jgi:hypothetical protein
MLPSNAKPFLYRKKFFWFFFSKKNRFLYPRPNLMRKPSHFGFARLKLQHEQFNPRPMERRNARGHLVVAADQASRRAAIRADLGFFAGAEGFEHDVRGVRVG